MIKLSKIYVIAALALLLLCGCGKEPSVPVMEEENAAEENAVYHPIEKGTVDYLSVEGIELEPRTEIAMVATNSENPFWDVVKKGAQKAIDDLNAELGFSGKDKVSLTFTAPEGEDVVEQINIIDQFLDKAPNALCIAFTDASACKTQMQIAKNNGIHLVTFDTSDESKLTEAYVGTDNQKASAQNAAKLFEAIGYEGKVAVIVHNSLTKTGQERKQAIVDELANNYNDKEIQFADIVYLMQEEEKPEEVLDKLLAQHPDLKGIICTDLQTTEMVVDYMKKLESTDLKVSGFDISEKIVNAVEDGVLIGTMGQDPYGMGYATITTAARIIANMPNAAVLYSGHQWVDADNLQTKEVQSLLNY